MIPGKKYTPEDLLRAGWRSRWLIVVPFIVIGIATAIVSYYLPNRYRSETLILVVPQRVPEQYVHSTVTTRIEDRLHSISQQILSRTRLERIIQDFNLYEDWRRFYVMEDIVERMRKDIDVQIIKGDAFRIAYTGSDARTVMKVTERLASLFIDESLRDREVLAEGTNVFLDAQLEDARRQLIQHEKKLEAFRRQFDGQLPSQVDANLQNIRSTEMQLQALTESLSRDRDRRNLIERAIADMSAPDAEPLPVEAAKTGEAPVVPVNVSPARQLEAARTALAALQLRLKPEHPDVVRMKRLIHDLEQKAEAERLEQPLSPEQAPTTPAERFRANRLRDIRAEADNLDRNIAAKQAEEKRLRALIAMYQTRIAAAPTRESELVELSRDYETLQKTYTTLLAKREDSKVAANLERRQIGEQFKVLDPARFPEKPSSPNRILINVCGVVGGLGLGLLLVALREYRDTSLKTDGDVALTLSLPVLALVPLIVTTAEKRAAKRMKVMMSVATAVVMVSTVVALVIIWKQYFSVGS
jgi:polysaccharide chain length determinant protein (PEP-CTERM system associated)